MVTGPGVPELNNVVAQALFDYQPMINSRAWIWLMQLCVAAVFAGDLQINDRLLSWVEQEYGAPARSRVVAWNGLIRDSRDVSDEKKLERVNAFFNRFAFVPDQKQWGQDDYWAMPIEFLSRAGGDCEDFSVAKYFTLKELGMPVEKLRLTYVKAVKIRQSHMVLAYYPTPDAEPLVLDNLVSVIKPASDRTDLQPVYSFNGDGLWLAKQRGKGQKVGQSSRLSHWADLTSRMQVFNAGMHASE